MGQSGLRLGHLAIAEQFFFSRKCDHHVHGQYFVIKHFVAVKGVTHQGDLTLRLDAILTNQTVQSGRVLGVEGNNLHRTNINPALLHSRVLYSNAFD